MNRSVAAWVVAVSFGTLALTASCAGRSLDTGAIAGGPSSAGASGAGSEAAPTAGAAGSTVTADAPVASAGSASDALPESAVEVALIPSADGSVNNELGVVGGWYPYADGNEGAGPGVCQTVGKHATEECSLINSPVPGSPFAPTGASRARMCISGKVAQVLLIGDPPTLDYSNMFGAGIGFDLNNPGLNAGTSMKLPFNASAQRVIGVAFDLDVVPATGMRVEFPFRSTSTAAGVWKANATWDWARHSPIFDSPVSAGHNVLLFANVAEQSFVPEAHRAPFDPTTLMSIQFHIPTNEKPGSVAAFQFCVDNLALIVQP